MTRRRRHGRVNHDRWLVSYADFITLLFAFFVVLFATGESDKSKKVQLEASIESAFREMGLFEAHTKYPPLAEFSREDGGAGPHLSPGLGNIDQLAEVQKHLEEVAQAEIARGIIGLHVTNDGLVISLQEAGFFDSGAAAVRPSELPVLERIATALPETALRVEGHTDDVPIHTAQFASNWELSSARASSIARLLLAHPNVHAEQMSVAGYAEYHPAASNTTAEGRARNRRVDIVLLKNAR